MMQGEGITDIVTQATNCIHQQFPKARLKDLASHSRGSPLHFQHPSAPLPNQMAFPSKQKFMAPMRKPKKAERDHFTREERKQPSLTQMLPSKKKVSPAQVDAGCKEAEVPLDPSLIRVKDVIPEEYV